MQYFLLAKTQVFFLFSLFCYPFFLKNCFFILGGPRIKQAERWRNVVPQNLFKSLLGENGPKRGAAFGEEFIYTEILNWGGDGG